MKNSTDLQAKAFIHKLTDNKVEIACIIANDINRKNITRTYKNMDALKKPPKEFLSNTISKNPFLQSVDKKKHTSKQSEGKHKYIWDGNTVMHGRVYKLVGIPWYKIEITVPVKDGMYKTAIHDGLKILKKCTKGLQKSKKPYYMQNGDEFFPLE